MTEQERQAAANSITLTLMAAILSVMFAEWLHGRMDDEEAEEKLSAMQSVLVDNLPYDPLLAVELVAQAAAPFRAALERTGDGLY